MLRPNWNVDWKRKRDEIGSDTMQRYHMDLHNRSHELVLRLSSAMCHIFRFLARNFREVRLSLIKISRGEFNTSRLLTEG